MLIDAEDTLHALALRSENITVEGEAVTHFHTFEEATAEAIHWIQLVCIILLQDTADRHNGMLVLVRLAIWAHVVKRILVGNLTV